MSQPEQQIPSRAEMEEQLEYALLPAFIQGLLTIKGPIDDEDRHRAQRLLEITATRESLTEFLQKANANSHEKLLAISGALPEMAEDPTIKAEVARLRQVVEQNQISDAIWQRAQETKAWAESILRGELQPRAHFFQDKSKTAQP